MELCGVGLLLTLGAVIGLAYILWLLCRQIP